MFELTDFKKVLPAHRPIVKPRPIDAIAVPTYGAADEAYYVYTRSKFEDGEILSYFKSKRISRSWVQYWMALQAALLFLQVIFYTEVSVHAGMYASTVHTACTGKEDVQGACKSRLWQRRVDEEYRFDSPLRHIEDTIERKFTTAVWASDMIQLSVIADPPDVHVPYEMVLKRTGSSAGPKTYVEYRTTGLQPVVIHEANQTTRVHPWLPHQQEVEWELSIDLAKRFGAPRAMDKRAVKSVRLIVNEMIGAETFVLKQAAPMCDIEKSWNSIMTRALSLDAGRLWWIKASLIVSIAVSAIVTFLVWTWFSGRRVGDGPNGMKFHYLVAAKTIFQDLPLQAIVLWYICSWYEAGGGERCQMCLLDVIHCEKLSPFHFSNFLLIMTLIASAVSNQALFTADVSQIKTEDDQFFVATTRVMSTCLMILPFSTAMVAFNGSLIQIPSFFHTLFLFPCFIGYVALFSLICFPLTTLIDAADDEFLLY